MFAKLIYIINLMNKIVLIILFLILLSTLLYCNKEQFTTRQVNDGCNSSLNEVTGEFSCGDNNCCLQNPTGGYCNVINENHLSVEDGGDLSSLSEERKKELQSYNLVVDPNKIYCVDFCVQTYTNTNSNDENFGEFKDENKLSAYVSSKCAECINNYYDRLKLLKNPYEQVQCTE